MIQQVDPPVQASVEVSGDLSVGAVNEMSYSQVLAVAQAYNIDLTRDDRGPSRGPPPRRLLTKPLNQAVQKPSSALPDEEKAANRSLCDRSYYAHARLVDRGVVASGGAWLS